jgi:hypothetical protein
VAAAKDAVPVEAFGFQAGAACMHNDAALSGPDAKQRTLAVLVADDGTTPALGGDDLRRLLDRLGRC